LSEATAIAESVEGIVPGVWHWRLRDGRIGGYWGAAHAVDGVLIDPHRLVGDAFAKLDEVVAVVLTTSSHQRSAWRFRSELGVPVYVPALAQEVEEEPDVRYEEGDDLPGGLQAIFTPGAGTTQHSLLLARDGGVLFTPDLFVSLPDGSLHWVPAEFMHDPGEARRSAERLRELEFNVLCTAHGVPLAGGAKDRLRELLQSS
jgi:glyoxylase-like metal-dependent hydrolase (beta-lactamase superfamily II)